MTASNWSRLAKDLVSVLHPSAPPVAITFSAGPLEGVGPFDAPMSAPAPDGRSGRVPAGCVFWMKAVERTFTTSPEDHGNCSVGVLTHGLADLDAVSANDDVAALVSSGWVTEDMFPAIPVVKERPGAITYGPLADVDASSGTAPDVVLVRLSPASLMVLGEAIPGLRIEGKPHCHIVAAAKEEGEVVASVGCALSRARTGMPNGEVSCAIPGHLLGDVVDKVRTAAEADRAAVAWAAEDGLRFSQSPAGAGGQSPASGGAQALAGAGGRSPGGGRPSPAGSGATAHPVRPAE